jgi:capsular exopolysaccharide synthesis family protein
LQRFTEANVFAPTQTTLPAGSLAEKQTQLDQSRRDLARIRGVLDRPPGGGKIDVGRISVPSILTASPALPPALVRLAEAEQNLQAQRAIYADGSPNVIRALAEYRAVNDTIVPDILRDIQENFEETEKVLADELEARRGELSAMPRRTFEGAALQQNYDQALQLWTTVNTSAQQARLLDEQTTADLTVLGEAITPPQPSSSRGPRIFILAVAASIGAGLAIALLLDRLDRRFRYPQQATMELGLTIAGTIPFFKPNRKGELNLTASAQVVESFRTLRLATQYHFPPGEPVIVCISSPGPGEGKSLVSSNLAVAFANAGQKTLLIDGDVRRGVVHTTFEAERRPGLVDYLGGTATPAQIVRPTSTDRLFIVPSGSRSRRAPELLTSERMGALVVEMRSQFEVIIIDSAPFVAGMDAFALGAAAGTMLVVLRPGLTDRKLAENKLELLDRLPVTIIGAVLNAISGGRAYRYYSEYTTYEGEDEGPDEADFDGPNPPTSPTRLIGRR